MRATTTTTTLDLKFTYQHRGYSTNSLKIKVRSGRASGFKITQKIKILFIPDVIKTYDQETIRIMKPLSNYMR